MKLHRFTFNMFSVNTYVAWNETSKEAAIIDPGMCSGNETKELEEFIKSNGLSVKHLLNTHMHIDHVLGNSYIEKNYGVGSECNIADNYLAERVAEQAAMFGMPFDGIPVRIATHLEENALIHLGDESLQVLYVPGHTKGHVAFYEKADGFVLTGDSLFQMSIGRTDLPGGDMATLINSIEQKLLVLPDNTIVFPGHGGKTTIAFEKENNPYLNW